jgi:hypothetical protein
MTIRESLHCAALTLLCAMLLGTSIFVFRLPGIINHQADATRAELAAQTHIAIVDANERLSAALDLLDRRSGEALAEVHATTRNADRHTGEALDILRTAAASIATQMSGLTATLKPIQETAQQLDDAAPLWLDCEFNPDCAFNRYQGVSKAFEKTAQVIAKEAPAMAASVDRIAASSAGVAMSADETGKEVTIAAKRFNAPLTTLQKVQMWIQTMSRFAGLF